MILDIKKLLTDHSIQFADEHMQHKHTRRGWIQINCPFCVHGPGWHLGYNLKQGYFVCYKCKFKRTDDVLSKILNVRKPEAWGIAKAYARRGVLDKGTPWKPAKMCSWPVGTVDLLPAAKKYLKKRGYDWRILEELYGLRSTNHLGHYKFRVIAPFMHKGVMVSYQGRDYTGRQDPPYKGCAKDLEVIPHKEMLYGAHLVPLDRIVLVEGLFDAWRIGPGAAATCGIAFTAAQVKQAAKFRHRFVLYDQEEGQAREAAQELASSLALYPGETELIEVDELGDPDEFPQEVINEIVEQLL